MPESTDSASKIPHNSMIILHFKERRVIVSRPISYEAAVASARKHFPEITLQSTVKFLCDELDICQGHLAEIPEEIWGDVINGVSSLTINASSRKISLCPSVSSSATLVPLLQSQRKISIKIDNFKEVLTFMCLPNMQIQHLAATYISTLGGREHRLFVKGCPLDSSRRLSDYGFDDGTVLEAMPKLVGGKPVIYLFSPNEIEASVSLSLVPEWKLSAMYPVVPVKTAVNGHGRTVVWHVRTKTNGDLAELNTGLDVSYLFWEAHTEGITSILSPPASPAFDESASNIEHFNPITPNLTVSNSVILPAETITLYLDKALNALGLHTEARTSFITYWLPSFLKHKHIALRFLPQTTYERAALLDVSPKPDITTRIFMLFKGVEDDELPYWKDAIDRASSQDVQLWVSVVGVDVGRASDASLFRILEWGGMEVPLGASEPRLEVQVSSDPSW